MTIIGLVALILTLFPVGSLETYPVETNEEISYKVRVEIRENYPEIAEFVRCESAYDPTKCSYAGCRSGMGLCQFIPSTWNATLKRIKESGDRMPDWCFQKVVLPVSEDHSEMIFDPECNLIACAWLYKHDGDSHWYPSEKCWQSKVGIPIRKK